MKPAWAAWGLAPAVVVAGCAGTPPAPPAAAPVAADKVAEEPADAAGPTAANLDAPERARPPSKASYDQAMAKPESVDVDDDRIQLTDTQLREPVNGVLRGCPVPSNAKVTIKIAVQSGRASGVSVEVRFDHPTPPGKRAPPPLSPAVLRHEAKVKKKVGACLDQAVRDAVWPPSRRRDSFTMEF